MNITKQLAALFFTSILLMGCQGDAETNNTSKKESKEEGIVPGKAISSSKEVELSETSSEDLIKGDKGELYKKYIENKEFADNPEAFNEASTNAIDAYIQEVNKKKSKNWDENKWTQSITSALQTSYKEVDDELKNYEVVYEELRLPDGRLLQDIGMEEITKNKEKKVNVVLVIDSSGSMKAQIDGESKMALAKKSIEGLAKELPDTVNVSLIAFGHQGTGNDADKEKSCKAVETFYPLQAYDGAKFAGSLTKFDSMGWTPLASSIELAKDQLASEKGENTENFIYVVSDGIETCDGDPVKAAKNVAQDNTNVKINIIGFDVDSKADQQLKEVAVAGGGEYSSVKTKQQLAEIQNVWKETINKNTWRWWAIHRFSDNIWSTVDHYNVINGLKSKYFTLVQNEENRFNETVNRLQKEGMIDSEKRSSISQVLRNRNDKIQTYLGDLSSKKGEEIKTESDELSKKLEAIQKQVGL